MHGLALVQQVEDLAAEAWVAEIVAQIDGAEQLTQSLTGGVDWITTGGRAEPLERLGRGAPAFSNGAGKAQETVPGARDGTPRYGLGHDWL